MSVPRAADREGPAEVVGEAGGEASADTAGAPPAPRTAAWLAPTIVYVLTLGAFGVTSKLALEHLTWEDLILWSGIGYAIVVPVMLIRGDVKLRIAKGTGWAVISAAGAIGALIALYIALSSGEPSEIVPISASYPAVALVFSAAFLKERISLVRAVGVLLVIGGVIMVTAGK